MNSDCSSTKSCINLKCRDPCPGVCGINAECSVINHSPSCYCPPGFTGNPLTRCSILQDPIVINPCSPSPCGPYSTCKPRNDHAVCACIQNYIGAPPACRPECNSNSECMPNKACINQRCKDPCPGTCGQNAECRVVNHNLICSCPPGQTGDPFLKCIYDISKILYIYSICLKIF
jgi:hypothetical protein